MGQIWLRSDGRVEKKGGGVQTDRQAGRQADRQTDRQRFLQLYIVDMQLYTLIFCSIISVTYQVFILINCSSRLVQCLRILDVNRNVEEGRGTAGGGKGRKE